MKSTAFLYQQLGQGFIVIRFKKRTQIAFDTTRVAQKKQELLVEFVCFDENTATVYENLPKIWLSRGPKCG